MIASHKKNKILTIHNFKPLFGVSIILFALILTACAPTPTVAIQLSDTPLPPAPPSETPVVEAATLAPPEPSLSFVRLPDGTEITIFPETLIDVLAIIGAAPEVPNHALRLQMGKIIVHTELPEGIWFSVINPFNFIATVTGSVMELSFDPATGQYLMNCREGACRMGQNIDKLFFVLQQQQGCMDQAGNFYGPFDNVDFEDLAELCDNSTPSELPPTATLTPAPPTATPDIQATATASCLAYENQFPGTPCP